MPFVEYYKGARILKRSARLKGRPQWQDILPDSQEGKDAYRIAAKHEARFSRAFLKAMRELLEDKPPKAFREAWKQKSIIGMESAIPLFIEGSTDQLVVWQRFQNNLKSAYTDVIFESGKAATKILNKNFKTQLGFSLDDGKQEIVEKAKKKVVFTVPVNPYAIEWVESHSLELIRSGLTPGQRDVVRSVIEDGFSRGLRAGELYEDIRDNIGLTNRDYKAVQRRRLLHEETGLPPEEVDRLTEKYRQEKLSARANLIARTETIQAQAAGRQQAWQIAQESGQLPDVRRQWISAPASPNPDRPCEICTDLDGKQAKIGEPYESIEGPIDGPTAHPGCVPADCLVVAPGIEATSKRFFDGDVVIITTALGNKFTGTLNHPILGSGGWRAAKTFQIGDNVISSCATDWISSFICSDHEDRPSPIHKVDQSFGQARHVSSVPMPTTAEDFHGDGMNGQVAIVRTDSMLHDRHKASFYEQIVQRLFMFRLSISDLLNSVCSFASFQKRCFSSSCGLIRRSGVPFMFFRRALLHHQTVGLQGFSDSSSSYQKQSSDFRSGDSEGFADRILRFTPLVTLDNVVNVDVQRFTGQVYNLQSGFSWYISQNLISHNCRCTETLVRAGG